MNIGVVFIFPLIQLMLHIIQIMFHKCFLLLNNSFYSISANFGTHSAQHSHKVAAKVFNLWSKFLLNPRSEIFGILSNFLNYLSSSNWNFHPFIEICTGVFFEYNFTFFKTKGKLNIFTTGLVIKIIEDKT